MTRDSEATLLDFCASQQAAFDESAWLEQRCVSREEVATVSLFLSGVDWFGHKQSLVRVADQLLAGTDPGLARMISHIGFDCARFSNMLKRRIGHA